MSVPNKLDVLQQAMDRLSLNYSRAWDCCSRVEQELHRVAHAVNIMSKEQAAQSLQLSNILDAQDKVREAILTMAAQLTTITNAVAAQTTLLTLILEALGHQFRSLTLTVSDENGNPLPRSNGMPFQLTDGGAGSHLFVVPSETDAAGQPVTVDPTKMVYAASDPTAFTVTPNTGTTPLASTDAKDSAGNPVMIAPGGAEFASTGKVSPADTPFQITAQDTANNLQAQDTVAVVPGAATSLSIAGTVA